MANKRYVIRKNGDQVDLIWKASCLDLLKRNGAETRYLSHKDVMEIFKGHNSRNNRRLEMLKKNGWLNVKKIRPKLRGRVEIFLYSFSSKAHNYLKIHKTFFNKNGYLMSRLNLKDDEDIEPIIQEKIIEKPIIIDSSKTIKLDAKTGLDKVEDVRYGTFI